MGRANVYISTAHTVEFTYSYGRQTKYWPNGWPATHNTLYCSKYKLQSIKRIAAFALNFQHAWQNSYTVKKK